MEHQVFDARAAQAASNRSYAKWRETPARNLGWKEWPWQVIGIVTIVIASWALVVLMGFGSSNSHFVFFIVPFFGLSGLFPRILHQAASKGLQRLRTDPSPVTQYAVRLELTRGGVTYACDYGYVMFVSDSVVYHGLATDFSFGNGSSEDGSQHVKWDPTYEKRCRIRWYEHGEAFSASFTPLVLGTVNRAPDLESAFLTWTSAIPTSDIHVLPPIVVREAYLDRKLSGARRWKWAAGLVLCTWFSVIYGLVASQASLHVWELAGPFLVFLAPAVIIAFSSMSRNRQKEAGRLVRFAQIDGTST